MCGISDEAIYHCLLMETALTLEKALEIAQGMGTALQNVREMQGNPQAEPVSRGGPCGDHD